MGYEDTPQGKKTTAKQRKAEMKTKQVGVLVQKGGSRGLTRDQVREALDGSREHGVVAEVQWVVR